MGDKMDDDKLRELIYENQNLIYSIIHRFRSRDVEDLFQVGCIGLIKAYQKYDSSMNVKFTSYAYNYIVGEIYQYTISNRNIRMSPANIKLFNSVKKAEEYLTNYLGRYPTIEEMCSFVEIEPYKYQEIQNMLFVDNIDNIYNLVDNYNLSKDELIDLKNALSNLTNEEKNLIKARYYN
ncbi:MAG: sigma-70 family RNA polymerase sigma factor, partial [Bacilli bacterium]|nr:sigma-70 family RNA polymerase sigma factor [Bacilli bacterium]